MTDPSVPDCKESEQYCIDFIVDPYEGMPETLRAALFAIEVEERELTSAMVATLTGSTVGEVYDASRNVIELLKGDVATRMLHRREMIARFVRLRDPYVVRRMKDEQERP